MPFSFKTFSAVIALSLSALPLLGQSTGSGSGPTSKGGMGASIFTVGTAKQVGVQHWAYLLWQPSEAGIIEGQRFRVYRKSGVATAPGNYVLRGDVQPRLTIASITQALATADILGEDREDLEHGLGALLKAKREDLICEERALAVLNAAINDVSVLQRLHVMSRVHPAISLVMGKAFAEPLPGTGVYTYEIRIVDDATGADSGVVGRVTINTTLTPLPAPASVYTFFEPNERGHLNAKIRWATPVALRSRALEYYGYNVYRVAKADAAARGWVAAAPTTAALLASVGDNTNPRFKRINDVPILTESDLDVVAAMNSADLKTYFVADDNGRFDPEDPKPALQDGDEFYYYAAALDILGRDGLISAGRLAAVYDTYPPEAARDLKVSNEYQLLGATRKQFLRVTWEAPPVDSDGAGLDSYLVYRWTSDRAITTSNKAVAAGGAIPAHIAVVSHVAGKTTYQFDDTGPGSPTAAVAGKTYWYTVRSRDSSKRPTGGNLSGNSVPAYGAIRDRQGPEAATGLIRLNCLQPLVSPVPYNSTSDNYNVLSPGSEITLMCTAELDSRLAWAEFVLQGRTSLGQYAMRSDGRSLVAKVSLPSATVFANGTKDQSIRVSCRVATHSGRVSSFAIHTIAAQPAAGQGRRVKFKGETQTFTGILGDEVCGSRHEVYGDGSPQRRSSLCGEISAPIPVETREYKIYRRVGDGPLTLVDFGPKKTITGPGAVTEGFSQVLDLTQNIDWCDRTVPSGVASLCYFVQTFDEHGNASPMAPLGCVESAVDLSAPTLLPIEPAGSVTSPQMTVRWFGNPNEATRYEVFVSKGGFAYNMTTAPSPGLSKDLSPQDGGGARIAQRVLGDGNGDFSVHETSMVSIMMTTVSVTKESLVSFTLPIELGMKYEVCVRAVGPGANYGSRAQSPLSNVQEFIWAPAPGSLPQVPWPARIGGAAQSSTGFHPDIIVQSMRGRVYGFEGMGVRIGAVDMSVDTETGGDFITQIDSPQVKTRYNGLYPRPGNADLVNLIQRSVLQGSYDPLAIVFTNETLAQSEAASGGSTYAGKILPMILYRYEVPSAVHPTVSNDVVQVTPMMEQIAYEKNGATGNTVIHDPWVSVVPRVMPSSYSKNHEMFLLDRRPVTSGASYRYVLVRLNNRTFEIERVLETAVITVP